MTLHMQTGILNSNYWYNDSQVNCDILVNVLINDTIIDLRLKLDIYKHWKSKVYLVLGSIKKNCFFSHAG